VKLFSFVADKVSLEKAGGRVLVCDRDVMKHKSSTASCSMKSSSEARLQTESFARTDRPQSHRNHGEVDRWVAMINAELDTECEADLDTGDDVVTTPVQAGRPHSLAGDQAAVEVTIEFGRALVDESVQKIGSGSVLKLDKMTEEPVNLIVDGRTIAHGELITINGKLGVRVVEVLLLFWMMFFGGIESSRADDRERLREQTPRRPASVKFAADEPDDEAFAPQPSNQKLTVPQKSLKTTRKPTFVETDAPLLNERTPKVVSGESIALTPPSTSRLSHSSKEGTDNSGHHSRSAVTGWGSTMWPLLAIVAAIVIGTRWLKLRSPNTARGLSSDVFDVLGRRAVDQRTSVIFARCGSRILVLSLSPHGLQTLSEITDPVEVDCLAGLCRTSQRDHSLAETFRALLHKPAPAKPVRSMPMSSAPTGATETSSIAPSEHPSSLLNESRWPDRLMTETGSTFPTREGRS
jgi:flagellar motor switch/type III secretory pathway protein FliN/flagellar biogenesis protein FliO